jgi:hypothetical protein
MSNPLASAKPIQVHLAGATCSALILAISGFAIYSSWEAQRTDIESSQLELTQVSAQLSSTQSERGKLINQISNLETVVQEREFVLKASSINELAVQLVAFAESQGLELEQFEPSEPKLTNNNPTQAISIQVTAPFSSIQTWLDELHAQMPDIHVEGLSIRANASADGMVSTNIRLNWYIPSDTEPKQ